MRRRLVSLGRVSAAIKRRLARACLRWAEKEYYGFYSRDQVALTQDLASLEGKYAELVANVYDDVEEQLSQSIPADRLPPGAWAQAIRPHMDELARRTVTCQKPVRLVHASGLILYAIVYALCRERGTIRILELGTSRGFSALMMAMAIRDAQEFGSICTVDVLPPNSALCWPGLLPDTKPMNRFELLSPWADLTDQYITFLQFDSPRSLHRIGLGHIDFAYIDAMHDYASVYAEASYIEERQRRGDLILFDDCGAQYPEIERAISKVAAQKSYAEKARFSTAHRPQPWALYEKQ